MGIKRAFLLAVAITTTALLVSQAHGKEEEDSFKGSSNAGCGIRCIAKGERANIITHTYDIPEEGSETPIYQLKLYSGACRYFDFTGDSTPTYLNLSTYEVRHETTSISTTQCMSYYDIILISDQSVIESRGNATFTINIPAINTGMRVLTDPTDGVPTGVELTQCAAPNAQFTLTFADKQPDLVRRGLEAAGTAEDVTCRSINGLMGKITDHMSDWVKKIRAGEAEPTKPTPYTPKTLEEETDLCDISQSAVFNVLRYAVTDVIGVDGIEFIMDTITDGTGHAWANMSSDLITGIIGGWLMFVTSDVLYSFPEGDFYNISEWSDVNAGAAASVDNYTFRVHAEMPALRANATWFGENYIYNREWKDLGPNDEHGGVRIGFAEPSADVLLLTRVNATFLRSLTPPQLIAPGCLLGALKEFKITSLSLNASAITDRGFTFEYGDFEDEFRDSLNSFAAVFAEAYAPHQVGLINGFYIPEHLNSLNLVIRQVLSNEWPCPDLSGYVAPPVINFLALWITLALTLVLWVVIIIVAEVVRHTGGHGAVRGAPSPVRTPVYGDVDGTTPPPTEAARLVNPAGTPGASPVYSGEPRRAETEAVKAALAAKRMPSLLMMADGLSAVLRYAMPLLIFVNISMFVISNASISASVFPTLVFGDLPVEIGSLFDFGLVNTIHDMWAAGVYPLAILIAFFSGAWPYIKLVLMLAAWCLPPRFLPLGPRESILRVVDALGKWSLIDSYVMTLMLVAFRYHIVIPAPEETPGDVSGPPPSYVDVIVDARMGFVLFVLATMLSLVLGHVILAIHRSVVARSDKEYARAVDAEAEVIDGGNVNADVMSYSGDVMETEAKAQTRVALRSLAFGGMNVSGSVDTLLQVVVAVLLVVSIALVCYGISIQSLVYDVRGLVGLLFDRMAIERKTEYSLVEMGSRVLSSSANPSSFTAILIVVIFFATAVVFPLLHLVVLVFLWLTPLALKAQRCVYVLVEVLNAWSALGVYVVSCLAALLQLRQFALWIVGDSCDFINPFIEKYLGGVVPGDPVCFDLVAKLDKGSWVLLAAWIIYSVASYFVMGRCHNALETRKGKK